MRLSRMLTAIDVHASGQPGRVIIGGLPDVPGKTMQEKATYLETHVDWLRKLMLREPRGYPCMCCNVVLPPTNPEADAGFVIIEHTEYPPMSGTNTICTATALLETGMIPAREPVTEFTLEAPGGLIRIRAEVENSKVKGVTFQNVPSFAFHLDAPVEVPKLGTVTVDIAYGGMIYALAQAAPFGLRIAPDEAKDVARIAEMIRQAAREQYPVQHPDNPALIGPTIAALWAPPKRPGAVCRLAPVMPQGAFDWDRPTTWTGTLDRTPSGTGTSAMLAALYAKGRVSLNEEYPFESVIGSIFTGRLVDKATVGPYEAVVPAITGTGWVYAITQYVLDPTDPFPEGYMVGDIWGGGASV